MPLPSSPSSISLNQINVEAGGSSNTLASINDSPILGLIGKSASTQMSFSEWYGASAAPTLSYTTYGSTYIPQNLNSKIISFASIIFNNPVAQYIVSSALTGAPSNGRLGISDAGYFNGAFLGAGIQFLQSSGQGTVNTISNSYIPSNTVDFSKNHGTSSGQHYFKVYYGSSLIFQTNAQYDNDDAFGCFVGDPSASSVNINSSRNTASSWRIEYYN